MVLDRLWTLMQNPGWPVPSGLPRSPHLRSPVNAFEILVPAPSEHDSAFRMELRADHWIDAWGQAVLALGDGPADPSRVTCQIGPDGVIEIKALGDGRKMFVRSISKRTEAEPDAYAKTEELLPAADPIEPRPPWSLAPTRPLPSDREPGRPANVANPTAADDTFSAPRPIPYIAPLDGGRETNLMEALEMLDRHVACESVHYLRVRPGGRTWEVVATRGCGQGGPLGGVLRAGPVMPGPKEATEGRRTFAGEGFPLRFRRGLVGGVTLEVKSAVWAPVVQDQRVVGVLLLLNARDADHFSDGELSAVRQLAQLLGQRLGPTPC